MIITICGSMKNKEKMMEIYAKLTEVGHLVFLPAMGVKVNDATERAVLFSVHFKKMNISNTILIVTDDSGYFGESTAAEIAYADTLPNINRIYFSNSKKDLERLGIA